MRGKRGYEHQARRNQSHRQSLGGGGLKDRLTSFKPSASSTSAQRGDTESSAPKIVLEKAGGIAGTIAEGAMAAGRKISSSKAGRAAAAGVDFGVKALKENSVSTRLKKARINGFRDGIKQGIYLAGEKRHNFVYAYVATLCYFLRCDGEYAPDEQEWLEEGLSFLKLDGGLPESVQTRVREISQDEHIDFDKVKDHLDKVSLVSLDSIAEQILIAISVDEEISAEEERAQRLFEEYLRARAACVDIDENWANEAVEKSVREYGENLERIEREFKDCTKLQDFDLAFLFGATMFQVARVLVINSLTQIERAGKSNGKETALHDVQNKLFDRFSKTENTEFDELYAPMSHILTSRGVPYDATAYDGVNLKLFKGANHRFATLGHDPVLGLLFGTSNIMTNTITCVKNIGVLNIGPKIPVTHAVSYDNLGKNPKIADSVSSIAMLTAAGRRVRTEPEAAAAALIKQIIHIGTDLYTPCGIQIPFANMVLDKAHAEKLTKYVSTGDILKVGAQAGLAALINWIVATLHGSALMSDNDDSDTIRLNQIRTKKIILISDTIATSSSVVQAALTKNPKCFDLGGAAVLAYRLFTDVRFIARVKEEFVNSNLSAIYDERVKDLW